MANPYLVAPWNFATQNQPQAQGPVIPTPGGTPGIWPIPPKPRLPQPLQLPEMPAPSDPAQTAIPQGYTEVPYGYDQEKMIPGRALYNGPKLNTEAALAPLRNLRPDPAIGMVDAIYDLRKTGRAQDLALANQYQHENDAFLAPQRASIDAIQKATTNLHPAIQESEEADAVRKAYPAGTTARGAVEAAQLGGASRLQAADLTRQGNYARANATSQAAAMRGLMDAMRLNTGESSINDPSVQKRLALWLQVLQNIGATPGMPDEDFDPYDQDDQ